ncbi:NAD(P)H-dependent oxidoreductase [Rathayibacter sp. VKM Ac-2929]|uniref:CE1759 family FMN reductase n=1 Tax=Rathayibacter sp. VKM Ac-2929 TaxID=2929480 RepID=UPI001FB5179A|nr:CE1759 family FMN reductase [Rathayibacter sp. VKM Ac-2929]MCJ1675538.1 NAD(P)H-dependent oxidoreductase [Rathayibacter sp. VKM Ac-2929]
MNVERVRRIVVINAGTSTPSSSRMIADRIAQAALDQLRSRDLPVAATVIELGPLAGEIAHAIVSGTPHGPLVDAIEQLAAADGLVVATPVYKAGMSGLLKSFIDILDNDLLIAIPVALSASAGSARHALVADGQLRPLFAFMRAIVAPTSVFAAPEDWADPGLTSRARRSGAELAALIASEVRAEITGRNWDSYQHSWGGTHTRDSADAIDLDTDLMRLATGGTTPPAGA